ncbi:MAG: putative ATPase [Lysobacterales bacterium]|jgi:predicted ATPase
MQQVSGEFQTNPYAQALEGLELPDPVASFFDYCRARENIRHLRESGEESPWSDDPIFQQGRFLNVFREDDRVSKSIIRFLQPLVDDPPAMVHAAFFARWCNKGSTLDVLNSDELANPESLKAKLLALPDQPWCNLTAYPVQNIHWQGEWYSQLEAASSLFADVRDFLLESIIDAKQNVIEATRLINREFRMDNDFPIFMAVIDLSWFRPDLIDPASPVPTGIGAIAFLDRLQKHLGLDNHQQTCDRMIEIQTQYWPEAKRRFTPVDIEYQSCECRKYYSYVNGTKAFEGKNRFVPGMLPRLEFEVAAKLVPERETQTQICVFAGGPGSGKSSLLKALSDNGYRTVEETAECLLREAVANGSSAQGMRADPIQWQLDLLERDFELFNTLPRNEVLFTDTSIIETLVFSQNAGIEVGPRLSTWLERLRFARVFFLEPLNDYAQTKVRMESSDVARDISQQIMAAYRQYGYEPIPLPAMPLQSRLDRVMEFVG